MLGCCSVRRESVSLKSSDITITTVDSGAGLLGLYVSDCYIVGISSVTARCVPWIYNGQWGVLAFLNGNPLSYYNGTFNVTVHYIEV